MNSRALTILSIICLLLTSCLQKEENASWELLAPEFVGTNADPGSSEDGVRYVVLSAELSSDKGVIWSGFMFGGNEASMKFYNCRLEGKTMSLKISNLAKSKTYCYYALAGNGRNQIRASLKTFTSSSSGKEDGEKEPDPQGPEILPPPPGVGVTVSDQNFFDYLLGICDSDKDGKISVAEAAIPQSIEVCTDDILTLDGIAYFSSLRTLKCEGTVWNGKLTGLALDNNSCLEELSCSHNRIEEMSLPASLKKLGCRFNKLSHLNTASTPLLVSLDCYGNSLQSLDLSKLTELEELICGLNAFSTLDLSSNLKLRYLDLSDATNLKTVYVAKGQKIDTIIADNSIEFKYKE